MKILFLVVTLAVAAAPARALWFNAGLSGASGPHSYSGQNGYVAVGGDRLSLKPYFSSYSQGTPSQKYTTVGARLGYDTKVFGLGLSAGQTGKVDGYSDTFAGADAAVSLAPGGGGPTGRLSSTGPSGGATGKGLTQIDLGAGVTYTQHKDTKDSAGATRATTLEINQTDFKASAGAAILDNVLTVQVTQSSYDKTLTGVANLRQARVQFVDGLIATLQGFPKTNVNARFTLGMLPGIKPFVQVTKTTYEAGLPDTNAYAAGGVLDFAILQVTASYQHVTPTTGTSSDFLSLGAGVRF